MKARITAIVSMTVAVLMLAALTASAAPKPPKHWNLYQDKLGVYSCTTADPKGQTLIAHPFATQAECLAALETPPTIDYVVSPSAPDGLNGWYVGNVALDWTVTYLPGLLVAPAPELTGCVDQAITADQQATTYECSATSIGGSAGPVAVTIKRDATNPAITWSGGIQDGDSFLVGSVPAEPTVEGSDDRSGLDTIGLTGYGTAVGSHTLVATATDKAGNTKVEQRAYTVTLIPATVVAPTVTAETCDASGGITIPTVQGIDYSLDGVLATGGYVELAAGTYVVTAAAQPDYELVGYPDGGWTLEIVAPSCVDITLTGSQLFVPSMTVGPAPVIDEVANTITYTTPVNSAATPTYCVPGLCPYLQGPVPDFLYGQYTVTTNVPSDVDVFATATLNGAIAGQESKFQLGYRSSTYGYPWKNVTGGWYANPCTTGPCTYLPVTDLDLEATDWGAAVGGHDTRSIALGGTNGLAVKWAGVTGTGTVTITLSFTATAL